MEQHQASIRQWANFIAILTAFATNVLANIAPINGLTIGEISNQLFPNVLITPASYAFAIWGLIYLGLISLGIYQVLPSHSNDPYLQKMGYFLVIASGAQILWVFLFLSRYFFLSVIAMLGILISLIILYLRLGISLNRVTKPQKWLINFPISLYFGWISVATIVNVALALTWRNWNGTGLSDVAWTIIMIIIAAILASIIRIRRLDSVYCGVFVWALVAISIGQSESLPIVSTASIFAGILILVMVVCELRRIKPLL
ncbi:MAG: tryptophan-rich sensory protein [Cyanobacteria bacterium P01_G01_bin.49]